MNISPIKEAWRSMYHLRTCPPSNIINNPAEKSQVEQHQRTCPICALTTHESLDPQLWSQFEQLLSESWIKPHEPGIEIGQVWSLTGNKGGWDDHFRHINPPLVLILEIFDDVRGLHVAQVFDQPELFADGDVDLGPELGFAETWNTYALDQADLHLCFGQVNQEVVELVLTHSQNDFPMVEDQSTIWFFRQLELEVGSRMAMEAMGRLMYRHDQNAIRKTLADPQDVRNKILAFDASITLPEANDGLSMLAQAKLPDQHQLMAAASTEQNQLIMVTLEQEHYPCSGSLVEIQRANLDGTSINVTGVLPDKARNGHLFAWWQTLDAILHEGQIHTLDFEDGYFQVTFLDKNAEDFNRGKILLLSVISGHETNQ